MSEEGNLHLNMLRRSGKMISFGTPERKVDRHGNVFDIETYNDVKDKGDFKATMRRLMTEFVEKDTDGEYTLKFNKPDNGWTWSHNFGPYIISRFNTIAIFGDAHLAPRQYGLSQRRVDFFKTLAEGMFKRRGPSDVCVFLGDFFDSRKVEAEVFTAALEMFKRYNSVHYIFVKGNHDRAVLKRELTWIEAMGAAINERHHQSPQSMTYNESSVTTGKRYIPVIMTEDPMEKDSKSAMIVVCVLDYAGANTKKKLAELLEELDSVKESLEKISDDAFSEKYYVLCGHFGVAEYAGGNIAGTISKKDPVLEQAREVFDFIFLGHIHKTYKMEAEGDEIPLCEVYGAGALETLGFDEKSEKTHTYNVIWSPGELKVESDFYEKKRKFIDVDINIDGCKSPTEYYERMKTELGTKVKEIGDSGWGKFDPDRNEMIPFKDAIVRITLSGEVQFDRLKLNIPKIRDRIISLTKALHIMIRNRLTLRGEMPQFHTNSTRAEMESHSIMNMTEAIYVAHEESLTDLMAEIKDEVDKGSDPTAMMNIIMNSRLMEDVINADKKSST